MNSASTPQAAAATHAAIDPVRTRYFLASFNLLFVLAAAALMYFYAESGTGVATAGASEDLLAVLIRTFCVLGVVLAGGAWLYAWVHFRQLNSD